MERTELTFRLEKWRAISGGIIESASGTFLILIAVSFFHAGATSKAIVAGGGSIGHLLAPLVVSFVQKSGWTTSRTAARMSLIGAGCFLLSALFPCLSVFVICAAVGMAMTSAAIPLVTQIYQENYPDHERGKRFSRTLMIRIVTAAAFSQLAGKALDGRIEYWRWLLVCFAGALLFGWSCLRRCPSTPLKASGRTHPLHSLRYFKEDPLFGRTLISWMLMGTAALMMAPLRVEYLANPKYGQVLSVMQIALLTGVIPNLIRLVLSPVWGWLFDNVNFFALRVVLNIGFMLGILTFFTSNTFNGFLLGAVVYGISNGGGDVAWSLWVTKFAPPDRVADYMAVHTFFTGLRGVAAPIVSFHLAAHNMPLNTLGWICASIILVATLMLLPELRLSRQTRPMPAALEP